jgi:hypothetical protein
MNSVNANKVRIIYGALVASVVLVPIKAATHPCSYSEQIVSAGDLFKSAGLSLVLAVWMTSLALALIVISGKDGRRATQIFWILATAAILVLFAYTIYQDILVAVADTPICL